MFVFVRCDKQNVYVATNLDHVCSHVIEGLTSKMSGLALWLTCLANCLVRLVCCVVAVMLNSDMRWR